MTDKLLDIFRRSHTGHSTDYIYYDTGGLLFEILSSHNLYYVDWSFHTFPAYCRHFCGLTRSEMYADEQFCSTLGSQADYIRQRLRTEYACDIKQYQLAP